MLMLIFNFSGLALTLTPSNEDYFISSNGHNPPKPSIFKLKPEPKPIIHSFTGEKVGPSGLLVDITKSVVDRYDFT